MRNITISGHLLFTAILLAVIVISAASIRRADKEAKTILIKGVIINIVAALSISLLYCIIMGPKFTPGGFSDKVYVLLGIIISIVSCIVLNICLKTRGITTNSLVVVMMNILSIVIFIESTGILEKIPFFSKIIP